MNTTGRGKRSLVVSGLLSLMILVFTAWLSWDHIQFWWLFESMGNNAQGRAEYRHRQTGIVFVRVPGGTFLMGSPGDEPDRDSDEFQHSVSLDAFLIAKYETTQDERAKIVKPGVSPMKGDKMPAGGVTWNECQELCRETGLLLPTEAQWEYACRGGTDTPFAFGTQLSTSQSNHSGIGNPPPNQQYRRRPVRVGSFAPNGFGLYDMHGNVWEWCLDAYDEEFYEKAESTTKNPVCTSTGPGIAIARRAPARVRRGGGWDFFVEECRSANRLWEFEDERMAWVGFRPAYYPLPGRSLH